MSHDAWRDALRIAVVQRDGAAIIRVVGQELPDDGLQAAGNALLVAMSGQAEGATAPAERCAAALRARGWDGDELLADELDRHGNSTTTLTSLPADLEELALILTGSFGEAGYLDLQTGEAWHPASVGSELEAGDGDIDFEDPSRWLCVPGEGSRASYRDMVAFIGTVSNARLSEALERAIHGKGAFHRFRATLERSQRELTRWHRYSDDAQLGRARMWLAEQGYRPAAAT